MFTKEHAYGIVSKSSTVTVRKLALAFSRTCLFVVQLRHLELLGAIALQLSSPLEPWSSILLENTKHVAYTDRFGCILFPGDGATVAQV